MKKQCRRKGVATVRELLRRGIWPANVPVPDIDRAMRRDAAGGTSV